MENTANPSDEHKARIKKILDNMNWKAVKRREQNKEFFKERAKKQKKDNELFEP